MLHEKALSKKQQRFFGIVRAAQKGTFKGETTPQVQRAAASMTKKDVKKFASTKHKGLPEKKVKVAFVSGPYAADFNRIRRSDLCTKCAFATFVTPSRLITRSGQHSSTIFKQPKSLI